MKTTLKIFLLLGLVTIIFTNCEKSEETAPPEIPPYRSMAVDFESFSIDQPTQKSTGLNYGLSALNIGVWSTMVTVTLAVPTAAFYASFDNEPEYLGDGMWQWDYEVSGFATTYSARLTGELSRDSVDWKMYIASEGINAHPEFMWFEGTSANSGAGGTWLLYQSYAHQVPLLKMNWTRENDLVNMVKYEYVRELTMEGETDTGYGTYLIYGKQEPPYDSYFTSHSYNHNQGIFHDVFIEWSSTEYNGHVKSEQFFNDAEWHCWNGSGLDTECE